MTVLLSNVFYDPSSPWYYVIGVLFLVLIFGALTAYIMLSKKFGKGKDKESDEHADAEQSVENSTGDGSDPDASVETEANADVTNSDTSENQ